MSRTAALVGVFGTVQSKYLVFGGACGVMHMVNVLPPSNDRKSSISHPPAFVVGIAAAHSILNCSPGYRTCPRLGEISLAEYVPPEAASAPREVLSNCGASTKATINNVEMNL